MYFRNDKHKALFKSAIKKMDKKDNVQMCIVYLLTAERKLWNGNGEIFRRRGIWRSGRRERTNGNC